MAKHHPDLIFCRKQPGVGMYFFLFSSSSFFQSFCDFITAIGRLCEKCDGKCVICDSYVRPCTLVRICDECNYGSYQGRCVICGGPGVSDAYYCKECTIQEKDVSNMKFHFISSVNSSPIKVDWNFILYWNNKNLHSIFREMDVRKLLTLGVPRQIYSTKEKNMDSRNDNIYVRLLTVLLKELEPIK